MEQAQNLLTPELQVDPIAHSHLMETAKWAKFLAVIGLAASILIAIASFFVGTVITSMTRGMSQGPGSAIGNGFITIIYLLIAAIYFVLSLFLFRFATKMKLALMMSDQENFNTSLLNLKLVYRIFGIIMIIYLGILALALIGSVMAAMFMR